MSLGTIHFTKKNLQYWTRNLESFPRSLQFSTKLSLAVAQWSHWKWKALKPCWPRIKGFKMTYDTVVTWRVAMLTYAAGLVECYYHIPIIFAMQIYSPKTPSFSFACPALICLCIKNFFPPFSTFNDGTHYNKLKYFTIYDMMWHTHSLLHHTFIMYILGINDGLSHLQIHGCWQL